MIFLRNRWKTDAKTSSRSHQLFGMRAKAGKRRTLGVDFLALVEAARTCRRFDESRPLSEADP